MKIGDIDPGHVIGPDGKRYLFMGGGGMVPLADDGLSVVGKSKKVYSGWQHPANWVVTDTKSFGGQEKKSLPAADTSERQRWQYFPASPLAERLRFAAQLASGFVRVDGNAIFLQQRDAVQFVHVIPHS